MGKVRRMRQRYHNLAKQTKNESEEALESLFDLSGSVGPSQPSLVDQLFSADALLAQPKITSQLVKNQLADFEERNTVVSTLSAKSSIYAGMKKKTKKDLRHQLWLRKVDAVQQAQQEAKEKKRRQGTAVVGDMQSMMDALPNVSSFLKDVAGQRSRDARMPAKYRPIKKQAARAKEQAQNAAIAKSVMNDPDYRADPFSAIQTHLRLKFGQASSNDLA